MNPEIAKQLKPTLADGGSGFFSPNTKYMAPMVKSDVVPAMAAPTTGEGIWTTAKRTRLSRAAKSKAAVSGKPRSRVRQVLATPFHESAMIPPTMEMAPRILLAVGCSPRNDMAMTMAKSGRALLRQEEIVAPRRSMPLKIKKREQQRKQMTTATQRS